MTVRALIVVGCCAIACRRPPPLPPLAPAGYCPPGGNACDDGAGELARASAQLVLGDDQGAPGFGDTRRRASAYGGDPYGGALYGGDAYGGIDYAGYIAPQPRFGTISVRRQRYAATTGLTGSVEGVVSWSGAMPAKVCGGPRIGSDRGVGGVLVYVEHVSVGRSSNGFGRPASVGGTLAKRGCALVPAAQLVTPLPATLMIHGDIQRASVKVQPPTGDAKTFELQEAGVADVELEPGVTRVDADRSAAWVVAIDTPYYAITDDAGRFRLDELAPGTYEVTFWQAPIPIAEASGAMTYGAPRVVHRTVKVDAKRPAQLSVSLGK